MDIKTTEQRLGDSLNHPIITKRFQPLIYQFI